jgi:Right handed beta helix region
MILRALIVATAMVLITVSRPPAVSARTLTVGLNNQLKSPSAAAAIAKTGDTIVIEQGEYTDCAVWNANNLVIEGKGDVVIRDRVCEDKAIFVTNGANITVRNITFAHARSSNKNGAGIRAMGENLTVEGSRFRDNENGILSGPNPHSRIVIRNSAFTGNGKCDPDCAHGIYIGAIDSLGVAGCVFLQQNEGHHIKSRALHTEIVGNTIKDGPVGTASFAVDVPDGGSLILRNNVIEKGPRAENHIAAVSIGEESQRNPTSELIIERNTFINDYNGPTTFVRNHTTVSARLSGNTLTGTVTALSGRGTVEP